MNITRRVIVRDAGRYYGDNTPTKPGEPYPTYTAVLEITIDLDELIQKLGRRAVLNKTKRSRQGVITVKAHSISEVRPLAAAEEGA